MLESISDGACDGKQFVSVLPNDSGVKIDACSELEGWEGPCERFGVWLTNMAELEEEE